MIVLSPSMLAAIACIITACSALVWSVRRKPWAPNASTASRTIHAMAMHLAWIVGAVAGSRWWIRCRSFCNASSAAGQGRWRRSRVGYVAHDAEAGTRVWDPPSVHNAGW